MSKENELPSGWVTARLQDVAPLGETYNPQANGKGEFFYVDIEAVDNTAQKIVAPKRLPNTQAPSRARKAIHTGDIIFSLVRPYLKNIAIVPQELDGQVASTAYCVMRPISGIVSTFVFYALLRESFINSITVYGNSPPSGHDDEFLAMSIPLAPTSEQHRIVAAIEQQFSRLDAAVAALRRAQAKLKRYRAAVLKAAVEGKLTEAWRAEHPTTEPASNLLERILAERRTKWEADLRAKGKDPTKVKYVDPAKPDVEGLPELPEGWCWATIGQLTWSVKDGPHYSPKYVNEGIPFITGGNVRSYGVDFANAKYITPELHTELSQRCKPEKGDILYTKGGTTGIARVNTYDTEFSVWVHVAVLKLSGPIEPFYVQHALNSPLCYTQAQGFTHGVGNQDLGLTRMVRIVLSLPPIAEQKQIVTEIERNLSVIGHMETMIETNLKRAERLRQSILKEAFAGRLVPQNPSDEPASILLERIRRERTQREQEEQQQRREVRMNTPSSENASKTKFKQRRRLQEILIEAGRPLPPDDLFMKAGLSADAVEEFYEELREQVGAGFIREVRPDATKVYLEVATE